MCMGPSRNTRGEVRFDPVEARHERKRCRAAWRSHCGVAGSGRVLHFTRAPTFLSRCSSDAHSLRLIVRFGPLALQIKYYRSGFTRFKRDDCRSGWDEALLTPSNYLPASHQKYVYMYIYHSKFKHTIVPENMRQHVCSCTCIVITANSNTR